MRGYHLLNSQKIYLLSSKVTWLCCRTGEHRLTANVELLPAWLSQPFSSGVQLVMKALWIARFGVFVKENARVTWNTRTVRISICGPDAVTPVNVGSISHISKYCFLLFIFSRLNLFYSFPHYLNSPEGAEGMVMVHRYKNNSVFSSCY